MRCPPRTRSGKVRSTGRVRRAAVGSAAGALLAAVVLGVGVLGDGGAPGPAPAGPASSHLWTAPEGSVFIADPFLSAASCDKFIGGGDTITGDGCMEAAGLHRRPGRPGRGGGAGGQLRPGQRPNGCTPGPLLLGGSTSTFSGSRTLQTLGRRSRGYAQEFESCGTRPGPYYDVSFWGIEDSAPKPPRIDPLFTGRSPGNPNRAGPGGTDTP